MKHPPALFLLFLALGATALATASRMGALEFKRVLDQSPLALVATCPKAGCASLGAFEAHLADVDGQRQAVQGLEGVAEGDGGPWAADGRHGARGPWRR